MRAGIALALLAWLAADASAGAQTWPSPAGGVAPVFGGSVPAGAVSPQVLPLSLAGALERGLAHNLGLVALDEQVAGARGARLRQLRALMPRVEARTDDAYQTRNLAAFGFNAAAFPGFPIPTVVGPFNLFDARVYASQPVIDRQALHEVRGSGFALDAAQADAQDARGVVTYVVTQLYFQAVAGQRRIETARAHVVTAEALLALATSQRNAGVAPGIDVVRAQVQLQTQQQRLIAAETEFTKQGFQLARAIGVPVAQRIELTDRDVAIPPPSITVDEAVRRAVEGRADQRAWRERLHEAEAALKAVQAEALPTVQVTGDYGAIGTSPTDARRTYTVAGSVRVPLFDVGRRGRELEASARLRQRQAEVADAAQRIEAEVRTAFLDVQASERQLAVARERVALARQELALAQTRFAAGVTSNLEVIEAQNAVTAATDAEVVGGYAFNVAKAGLARAIGTDPTR